MNGPKARLKESQTLTHFRVTMFADEIIIYFSYLLILLKGKIKDSRTARVLDTMMAMQARQSETGGSTEEEMEYDDVFIFDNVSVGVCILLCTIYTMPQKCN